MADTDFAILRFDGEPAGSGSWQHTEYVIEVCIRPAPPDDEGAPTAEPTTQASALSWTVRRRYSDFLHHHTLLQLLQVDDLPELPPKEPVLQKVLGSAADRDEWKRQRQEGLRAYTAKLLEQPRLWAHPYVQQLLSLGPAARLSLPPEPPEWIQVRPLAQETGADGQDLVPLRICARIANPVPMDGEVPSIQVPVAEIEVIFYCEDEGDDTGHEAACVHLPVKSTTEEVHARVDLAPGPTYTVEARALSTLGLRSPPVVLLARVPSPREGIAARAVAPLSSLSGGTDDFGSFLRGGAPVDAALVAPAAAIPCPLLGEAATWPCHERHSDSEDEIVRVCSQPRRTVAPIRIHGATFRGQAASEYIAAASEKLRRSYEKTPYQLDMEKRHLRAEFDETWLPGESLTEHTVHRDAGLLDQERVEAQRQERRDEAHMAAAWVVEMTGRSDVLAVVSSHQLEFREALLSGVVLCELANAVASRVSPGLPECPITAYNRTPATRFHRIENVGKFLAACRDHFDVPDHCLFRAADLEEGEDGLRGAVKCIGALRMRLSALII